MQASKSFAWRRERLVMPHWPYMKRLVSNSGGPLLTMAPTLSASSWKACQSSVNLRAKAARPAAYRLVEDGSKAPKGRAPRSPSARGRSG
jgi:hypothetical protein